MSRSLSNPSPDPSRDLKPSVSAQATYSASPSQLTLQSDMPSALPNPYSYNYVGGPHDASAFAFPPTSYRQHLGTQAQLPPPQHLAHHHPQTSPTNMRKRRASELGDPTLPGPTMPGPTSSNTSAYGNPTGLVPTHDGLDVGIGAHHPPPGQMPPLTSPVVKKGRTNTPWTPAEEQRLKALRDAGSSWSEIAKTFPTRTEGSVKKHWYKDMHYAEFAEDEVSSFVRLTAITLLRDDGLTMGQSTALLQAIKDYENNKWKAIGAKVGKPAKACEQFAKEQGWKV